MNQYSSYEKCMLACGLSKKSIDQDSTYEFSNRTSNIYTSKHIQKPSIKWFLNANFEYLPKPLDHEWLAVNKEKGQTFANFVDLVKKNNCYRDFKNIKIKIVPINIMFQNQVNYISDELKNQLCEFVSIFFNRKTSLSDLIHIEDSREYSKYFLEETFDAKKLISILKNKREPCEIMVGLTMYDISSRDDYLLFGQSESKNKTCVCSLCHYIYYNVNNDKKWLLNKACSLVCHEIGHVFGLEHCIYYRCIMNGSNSFEEDRKIPSYLCPICLNKLNYLLQFDIEKRYLKIANFYKDNDLLNEYEWHLRSLDNI